MCGMVLATLTDGCLSSYGKCIIKKQEIFFYTWDPGDIRKEGEPFADPVQLK
jgi:hypothetical protein